MKQFIRTLIPLYEGRLLWHDKYEKEIIRKYLNYLGFYVLTGTSDSLDVYLIKENVWWK